MASKMSPERLLKSYKRATAERGRIDARVAKAQRTLEGIDEAKADAQETIATADASKAEVEAQLEHLRTIARNRGVDLDAELANASDGAAATAAEDEDDTEDDDAPAAQPAPGVPAFAQ